MYLGSPFFGYMCIIMYYSSPITEKVPPPQRGVGGLCENQKFINPTVIKLETPNLVVIVITTPLGFKKKSDPNPTRGGSRGGSPPEKKNHETKSNNPRHFICYIYSHVLHPFHPRKTVPYSNQGWLYGGCPP